MNLDAQSQVAAMNHSDPVSRSLVRKFLPTGPFCHRDLVSGPAVKQKNGRNAGYVYGCPNLSVVDAMEEPSRL